jgi:hypothetical protein
VKKGMMLVIGGLVLLAGCGPQGAKNAGSAAEAKWKGAPYRLAFDTQAVTPNPKGVTIPVVKYTANPDALETRAILVTRFEATGPTVKEPVEQRMVGEALDLHGAEGAIPPDYMARVSNTLTEYLADHCLTGQVKVSVSLVRSTLLPSAGIAQIDNMRLSDWLPTTVEFKNPHPKCR